MLLPTESLQSPKRVVYKLLHRIKFSLGSFESFKSPEDTGLLTTTKFFFSYFSDKKITFYTYIEA